MKVIMDGQELPFEKGLEESIANRLKQENMVIRFLRVNNVDMVNASLKEILDEPSEGKVVEVTTCPAEELAWEAMRDAREYIPKLLEGLPRIRERLMEGNLNAVNAMVDSVLEGMEWLGLTFQAFFTLDGESPEAKKLFMEEYARLPGILKELEPALRENRVEAACDIFEQQVASFLKVLLSLVEEVLKKGPER